MYQSVISLREDNYYTKSEKDALLSLDIEKLKKNLAGLTDAEKMCMVELYHEFDQIIQIVIDRAQVDVPEIKQS